MMLAVLLLVVGAHGSALADVVPAALTLAGIGVTGGLPVWDLKHPEQFYYLFTKPQWRSWLTIGAQFINLAALVDLAFLLSAAVGAHGVRDALRWAMIPAGVMLASYTAFLFNQCEGRDLWQSPLLFAHTISAAVVAGAGGLGIAAWIMAVPSALARTLGWALVLGLAATGATIALDLFLVKHPTRQAERAARNLWRDLYARRFWLGGVVAGLVVPAALGSMFLAAGGIALLAAAGVLGLAGLWFYEDAWIRAGQSVPLS
jgi:formate-dependent nitrite reductase membrane component NrfD